MISIFSILLYHFQIDGLAGYFHLSPDALFALVIKVFLVAKYLTKSHQEKSSKLKHYILAREPALSWTKLSPLNELSEVSPDL